jgi:hypothetical protein
VLTGEVLTAQIFVAVLGTSHYTYAEATFTQSLPDWIASHVPSSAVSSCQIGYGCTNGVPAFQRALAGRPEPPQLLDWICVDPVGVTHGHV